MTIDSFLELSICFSQLHIKLIKEILRLGTLLLGIVVIDEVRVMLTDYRMEMEV
jgi:hypothetical protein